MLDTLPLPLCLIGTPLHATQWAFGPMLTTDSPLDSSILTFFYGANLDIMTMVGACSSVILTVGNLATRSTIEFRIFGG